MRKQMRTLIIVVTTRVGDLFLKSKRQIILFFFDAMNFIRCFWIVELRTWIFCFTLYRFHSILLNHSRVRFIQFATLLEWYLQLFFYLNFWILCSIFFGTSKSDSSISQRERDRVISPDEHLAKSFPKSTKLDGLVNMHSEKKFSDNLPTRW